MVYIYWFFIVDCVLLGWLGQKPVEDPYILLGQIMTVFYFLFFALIPVISLIESSDQKKI